MIEYPPLVRLNRGFPRPAPDQVVALAGAQTGHLADALGGRAALEASIKPVDPLEAKFTGVAVTCHAGPGDILGICAALELSQPGDVIVVATDGYRATAMLGDILLKVAKNRGIAAIVTDGCVRDIEGIEGVGLPCFATGITPDSPNCTGPCDAGLPVTLGGRRVASGDILVGDRDGVVVIPQERIDAAIAGLDRVRAAEAALIARVWQGEVNLEAPMEILRSDRVAEIG